MEQKLEEKSESTRGRKNESSIRGGGAPFGVDRDPTDYSNSSYMQNNDKLRGGKKTNNYFYNNDVNNIRNNLQPKKKDLQEGEEAFNIFKKNIKERGTRGIFSIRRCFMIYDVDNTRLLTFANFYKFINNFMIPLSRNQSAALFHLFDANNKGAIIYDELINELCDNFN